MAELNIIIDVRGNAVTRIKGLNSSLQSLGITTSKGQAQFQLASAALSRFGVNLTGMAGMVETAGAATAGMAGGIASLVNPVTAAIAAIGALTVGLGALAVKLSMAAVNLAVQTAPLDAMKQSFDTTIASIDAFVDSTGRITSVTGEYGKTIRSDVIGTGDDVIAAFKQASSGMLSMEQSILAFNKASSLVNMQFAFDLIDMTPAIIAAGNAIGIDATKSIDRFTTGISRMQPKLLDDIGITIRAADAYRNYAASVGKSVTQLTAQEKQMAFNQEAQKQLQKITADMPDITNTAFAQLQRMEATTADITAKIGLSLQQGLQNALPGINILLDQMLSFWENHGDAVSGVIGMIGASIGTLAAEVAVVVAFFNNLLSSASAVFGNIDEIVNNFIESWAEAEAQVTSSIAIIIEVLSELAGIDLSKVATSLSGIGALTGGIPSFQTGVGNFQGGVARVHKDETLLLPRGTSVLTKDESRKGGGMPTIGVVNIYPPTGKDFRSIMRDIRSS
jgi:hypothetical protein